MEAKWAVCSACGKPFLPRFRYQVDGHGASAKHYCSVSCRNPELRDASSEAPPEKPPEQRCTVCAKSFSVDYAFQVVSTPPGRVFVCSSECREGYLARLRPVESSPRGATRVVAVLNQKGGTGKTTTSVSVAAGLARRGHRTLLVDVDAQGNVASSLGLRPHRTLYHVLVDGLAAERAIVRARKDLDVLLSDQTLAAAELDLVAAKDRSRVLERSLQGVCTSDDAYEFVLLDCAPSLSLLNQNALVFADEVLIPVSCDYLALVGVKQILRTLRHVNEVLLHPVEVTGVLPTLFDKRNRISKESVDALRSYFGDKVLPPVRINARLTEAPSHSKTIFEYAPDSHGAKDYAQVVSWLISRAPKQRATRDLAVVAAGGHSVERSYRAMSAGRP